MCIRDRDRDVRKNRYRAARNRYFAMVRQEKRSAWEKFITVEGNRDPWGMPYKVVSGQSKKELLISTMNFGGHIEHDIGMLTEKLLDSLLPTDPQGYSDADMEIIRRAENCRVEEDSPEINEEEVKCALFSMGKKKAPGFDDLTVEILCKAWDSVRGRVTAIMNRALQEGKVS